MGFLPILCSGVGRRCRRFRLAAGSLRYRRDMVYGMAADFETAIATLKTLANTLKER
jgi:hypothetical protein